MLVGCCGAGGVGKTTTAKALVERLNKKYPKMCWRYVPSRNRDVFARRGLEGEAAQNKMTPAQLLDLQMDIWETKFNQDQELAKTGDHIVMDRTPIDNTAYLALRCIDAYDEPTFNRLRTRSREAVKLYTTIFYFPLVTYPGSADGMRETHFGKRAVHAMCCNAEFRDCTLMGVPSGWVVPRDEVDARVDFMMNRLAPHIWQLGDKP